MDSADDNPEGLLGPLLEEEQLESAGEDVRSLMPQIYGQLRALAGRHFAREQGSTLQPTALVHEAFLRLASQRGLTWRSRTHFFAIAAREVRRVLVDHWRKKTALRGPGADGLEPLEAAADLAQQDGEELSITDMIALDEALTRLAACHGRPARVAELAIFAGLTQMEIAEVMEVSRKTIAADWSLARAWLVRELNR